MPEEKTQTPVDINGTFYERLSGGKFSKVQIVFGSATIKVTGKTVEDYNVSNSRIAFPNNSISIDPAVHSFDADYFLLKSADGKIRRFATYNIFRRKLLTAAILLVVSGAIASFSPYLGAFFALTTMSLFLKDSPFSQAFKGRKDPQKLLQLIADYANTHDIYSGTVVDDSLAEDATRKTRIGKAIAGFIYAAVFGPMVAMVVTTVGVVASNYPDTLLTDRDIGVMIVATFVLNVLIGIVFAIIQNRHYRSMKGTINAAEATDKTGFITRREAFVPPRKFSDLPIMIIVFLIIGALMIPALHSVNNFDNPYKVTKNSTSEATITVSETDLRKVYAGQTAASFNSAIAKNDTALALSFVCDASRTEASTELASLGSVTYKNKDGTTRTSQITNYEKYDSLELTGVSTNQTPIIQVTMRDLSNKGEVDYATYYVHTDSATDKQCISAVLYSDDNYDVSRSVAGFGQKE